jgi:hypothetical protein
LATALFVPEIAGQATADRLIFLNKFLIFSKGFGQLPAATEAGAVQAEVTGVTMAA